MKSFERAAIAEEEGGNKKITRTAQPKTGRGVKASLKKSKGSLDDQAVNEKDRKILEKYREQINKRRELEQDADEQEREKVLEEAIFDSNAEVIRKQKAEVHSITAAIARNAEQQQERTPEEEQEIEQALISVNQKLENKIAKKASRIVSPIQEEETFESKRVYDQGKRELDWQRETRADEQNAKAYFAEKKARRRVGEDADIVDPDTEQQLGTRANEQDKIEGVRKDLGITSTPIQAQAEAKVEVKADISEPEVKPQEKIKVPAKTRVNYSETGLMPLSELQQYVNSKGNGNNEKNLRDDLKELQENLETRRVAIYGKNPPQIRSANEIRADIAKRVVGWGVANNKHHAMIEEQIQAIAMLETKIQEIEKNITEAKSIQPEIKTPEIHSHVGRLREIISSKQTHPVAPVFNKQDTTPKINGVFGRIRGLFSRKNRNTNVPEQGEENEENRNIAA